MSPRRLTRLFSPLLLAVLLACGAPGPAQAAQLSGEIVIEEGINLVINTRDDSWSMDEVLISHGQDTRITADRLNGTERAGDVSELDLTGDVHIEFRGATLNARSAEVIFRGGELVSVQVEGSQAEFSHLLAGYARRIDGRANAIRFETASGKVRFSGNTSYTDGRHTLNSEAITYDINDGTVSDDGDPGTRGRAIIRLGGSGERVSPPREPDRSTAQ